MLQVIMNFSKISKSFSSDFVYMVQASIQALSWCLMSFNKDGIAD